MSLARIRKGDTVVVISGRDKGKTGRVLAMYPEHDRALVEGVNKVKRLTRASAKSGDGGIIEAERPIFACKLMPVDPETGKGTRVRTRIEADGSKVRIAVKSGKVIKHETV